MTSSIVTEVNLTFIQPVNGLFALARIIINNAMALDSIGVHRKLSGGYRLTYPNKSGRAMFHPISKQLALEIEQAIFDEISKHQKDVNDAGYHRTNTLQP